MNRGSVGQGFEDPEETARWERDKRRATEERQAKEKKMETEEWEGKKNQQQPQEDSGS